MIRTGTSLIVAFLLFLAGLNIAQRWSWRELEDGVLWKNAGGDIVAAEIAMGTAADRVEDVVTTLHGAQAGQSLRYTIARVEARQQFDVALEPVPSSPLGLYI